MLPSAEQCSEQMSIQAHSTHNDPGIAFSRPTHFQHPNIVPAKPPAGLRVLPLIATKSCSGRFGASSVKPGRDSPLPLAAASGTFWRVCLGTFNECQCSFVRCTAVHWAACCVTQMHQLPWCAAAPAQVQKCQALQHTCTRLSPAAAAKTLW